MKGLALAALLLGSDLRLQVPADAKVDDQWFRSMPAATVELAAGRVSIERYDADNPLGLKPSSFPAALTTPSGLAKVSRATRTYRGRKMARYELARPAVPARGPDVDLYGDLLGPGKPGVRSKVERCVANGAYALPAAYREAREDKDPEGMAAFRRLYLDDGPGARRLEACLGTTTLERMRRGETLQELPRPPDEAELARQEEAETIPATPEGRVSVAVVEAEGRFYVLRFSAATKDFKKGLAQFEKMLASLEVLPTTRR